MTARERDSGNKIGIPEERQGKVRSWSEMSYYLELTGLDACDSRFARSYFRAQKFIADDKKVKAKRLFNALDKMTGYSEFEEQNSFLLMTIDVAVRGKSVRK